MKKVTGVLRALLLLTFLYLIFGFRAGQLMIKDPFDSYFFSLTIPAAAILAIFICLVMKLFSLLSSEKLNDVFYFSVMLVMAGIGNFYVQFEFVGKLFPFYSYLYLFLLALGVYGLAFYTERKLL